MQTHIHATAALIRQARHVAVLTGAGISAASGIPTFRDPLTGLWSRFDASELATAGAFENDRELVWGWYEWRRMKVMQAQPNAAHRALAELAARVPRFTLITQNVDDLHERAGNSSVLHLHGSLFVPRCLNCGLIHDFSEDLPAEPEGGRRLAPPSCARCGGPLRPGVVWFNEFLPEDVWNAAEAAVNDCDLLLVIGTSGKVYPAAGLSTQAQRRGKPVVIINPDATPQAHDTALTLSLDATAVMPAVMAALKESAATDQHRN